MSYFDSYAKQAFVSTVLQGLPQPEEPLKALEDLLRSHIVSTMPAALRTALAQDPKAEEWLNHETKFFELQDNDLHFRVGSPRNSNWRVKDLPKKVADRAEELRKDINERRKAIRRCKEQLEASLTSCRTIAAARKRMPEFAHLLPQEDEKTANLPTTNLVDTLKKFGWVDPRAKKAA